MLSFDTLSEYHFPASDGGFLPWDCQDPPFVFQQEDPFISTNHSPEPVFSNPNSSSSGSAGPNRSNSGSDEPDRVSLIDERKRRRMLSNRESARRSRMRKQKHLENLRNQVNRLRIGNRDMMNLLRLVTHQTQFVRTHNDRLRSESAMLRQKLWDIRQVLLVRQLQQQISPSAWPCNNFTSINEQNLPPLTT